jgi:DNA (cytosine-5)-methyltransferase 1
MGDVLGDLAASGYDTEWDCIPAAAVGAPHLRYRVFIVAHANGERRPWRARVFGQGWWSQLENGGWWTTEPDVGRVAHGVPSRVDRLRGLGNAVVPQVAEWIGRRLMESA